MTARTWRTYAVSLFNRPAVTIAARSRSAARWEAISRAREVWDFDVRDALRSARVTPCGAPEVDGYDYVRRAYGVPVRLGAQVRDLTPGGRADVGAVVYPNKTSTAYIYAAPDMTPAPQLPRDRFGLEGDAPKCPWCAADMSEATVTLAQLAEAHHYEDLAWAPLTAFRQAEHGALVVACPTCQRPSAIALQEGGAEGLNHWTRALAVRTAKDLEFLEGAR